MIDRIDRTATGIRIPVRPTWPWIVTGLVIAGALAPEDPLRDPATGDVVEGVVLRAEPAWIALAPVYGVWDRLSLLPLPHHYALLLSLMGLYLVWRIGVRWRAVAGSGIPRGIGGMLREGALGAGALGLLLSFYLLGALLPRPMRSLEVTAPELLVLDLHAHTGHSHDVPEGFSTEDRRRWHEAAGFQAALITDHYTWQGWRDGAAANPEPGTEGLLLLRGAELKLHRRHVNVIGDSMRYRPFLDAGGRDLDTIALASAVRSGAVPPPTILMPLPVRLDELRGWSPDEPLGLVGIEVNDASPRGLRQSLRDRALLMRIADSLDLATVAGSNHHGWGRTAAAWNLVRIPGWQTLGEGELTRRIEELLHRDRRDAVQVVERVIPWHGEGPVMLAMTLPVVGWRFFRMMGWGERVSWLLWTWGIVWLVRPRGGRGAGSRPGIDREEEGLPVAADRAAPSTR